MADSKLRNAPTASREGAVEPGTEGAPRGGGIWRGRLRPRRREGENGEEEEAGDEEEEGEENLEGLSLSAESEEAEEESDWDYSGRPGFRCEICGRRSENVGPRRGFDYTVSYCGGCACLVMVKLPYITIT